MYQDLQYLAARFFGIPVPQWLSLIKTFGLFLAIAFIIASYVLVAELKRKENQNLLHPEKVYKDKSDVEGKVVYPHQRVGSIIMLAMIGGIVGAKIFNAFETWNYFVRDPKW
jgi:prolipoprotein diacylglyceryltransferase